MEAILLDAKGLKCPLPVIRARKAIKQLAVGSLLRIECTDPLAEIDIPHMAASDGHNVLERGRENDLLWYLILVGRK
jgi:tRNA 2-thiouridine synthesizing protein A